MRLFGLLGLWLFASSCEPYQPPVYAEPNDTARCPDACAHLRALHCPEGEPLPDGVTCEAFCEETQKNGHALNPTCVATIQTCGELASRCDQ